MVTGPVAVMGEAKVIWEVGSRQTVHLVSSPRLSPAPQGLAPRNQSHHTDLSLKADAFPCLVSCSPSPSPTPTPLQQQ